MDHDSHLRHRAVVVTAGTLGWFWAFTVRIKNSQPHDQIHVLLQPLLELPGGGSLGGSESDVLGRLRQMGQNPML